MAIRRVLLLSGLVFSLVVSVPAYSETIEAGKGSLKLGLILQPTISWTQNELAPATSMTMKRARFLLSGEILPGKIKYFVQTEAVGSPTLLDMKLQFYYLPKTEIAVGRFLPSFTTYMPMSTAKLDLINYPLMVTRYGMWRQVGIQTTTTTSSVDFSLGLFNGYPSNNWTDNNDGKDFLVRFGVKPSKGLVLFGNAWLGNAVFAESTDLKKNLFGGGVVFDRAISGNRSALSFRGECLWGSEGAASGEKAKSFGAYANIGWKINPSVECLVRYDRFDPDTKTGENGISWITTGVNYYLQGQNVMLYLNYIKKINETGAGLKDPKDDEVILQVQVFF